MRIFHASCALVAVVVAVLVLLLLETVSVSAWIPPLCAHRCRINKLAPLPQLSDDWSTFAALDDDDVLDSSIKIDTTPYALEEDSQDTKREVGSLVEPPSITDDPVFEPLFVPAGSQLELSQDTVLQILQACRQELGTLFGYSAENRGVGITGGVDFVTMDGPTVVVRLKGRYWHQRTTVLDRVANYLQQRIPEIIDVIVEDPYQLTDEANQ